MIEASVIITAAILGSKIAKKQAVGGSKQETGQNKNNTNILPVGSNSQWEVMQPVGNDGRVIKRNNDRGSIQTQPNGSVTCGQHSCGMVLNTQGNPIKVDEIISKYPPDVAGSGTYMTTLKKTFSENGVGSTIYNQGVNLVQIQKWTENGKPAIATVKTGDNTLHFIVVDGVIKKKWC